MTPALTPTGLALLAAGCAFLLTGAALAAWPLLALGFAQISLLLFFYVVFVPASAMLRRRNLELAWWVPAGETHGGALVADRPLALNIMLRNRSPFRLTVRRMEIVASSAIAMERKGLRALVPGRREVRLEISATPRSPGYWFFQGVLVQVTDRFGVFGLQLYYPSLLGIKVFPPLGLVREPIPFSPRTGASHERVGTRLLRQRGLGTDLREIREHIPGDPFKRIAWGATARMRKLMVRELESEVLVTHWLLLDISSTMRSRRPGRAKLDYGLGLCAALARAALDAGDRVGLATFDHRIYSQVKPGDGQAQLYRIVERLIELNNVVDEDLTDLTEPELLGAVAEYLAYQEGAAVAVQGKLPNGVLAPEAGVVEGPGGKLFNAEAMLRRVRQGIQEREAGAPRSWTREVVGSSELSRLARLYCRLSGLEIPYHRHSPIISKERGMAEALQRAAASRSSQFIVLVSDLEEINEDRMVLDALRLARKRGHGVVVVAPFAPHFFPEAETGHAHRVAAIFSARARRRQGELVGKIERLGVQVVEAAPGDALPLILRRLARYRILRSGRPV